MSHETDLIADVMRDFPEKRLVIRTKATSQGGHSVTVHDEERPNDLKAKADRRCGEYVTDGKTYEALIGYDITTDANTIVVYRLPRG
jgi:hypothetical protein